jgi:hypothetical protein
MMLDAIRISQAIRRCIVRLGRRWDGFQIWKADDSGNCGPSVISELQDDSMLWCKRGWNAQHNQVIVLKGGSAQVKKTWQGRSK